MIKREDILSLAFLKKSAFTGSCQGMRYRLSQGKEEEDTYLEAAVWEGPYNYEATKTERKEYHKFPFSEEGICEAVEWLNHKWEDGKERFLKAQANW